MLPKKKIDRINELGRLSKERALTPAEQQEQQALRQEYITWFRETLRGEKTGKKEN